MADVVTTQSVRTLFPEFANTVYYPDAAVQEWIDIATLMVRADRWGTMYATGVKLFVAHNLVLGRQAAKAASRGGVPGVSKGPINSESVSKVSVGFDTVTAAELDGGFWNLTTYGTRFLHWARMMGTGGLQVPDNAGLLGPAGTITGGGGFFLV